LGHLQQKNNHFLVLRVFIELTSEKGFFDRAAEIERVDVKVLAFDFV
jgi:hypothetical protein